MRVIWTIVIAYVSVVLLAWLLAERVIFQPPAASYAADDLPIARAPVDNDAIAVLHLPNDTADYTILYSHGNAEDLGHLRDVLAALHEAGFGVLAYDYRGYGLSSMVRPTARRASADLAAVHDHATRTLGVAPDRIILYGRSVGSGPTLELAAQRPAAGVVLESAFTSTYRVLTRAPLLPLDRFPNIRRIRQVHAPVLVIHGTADAVIPFSHGRALYAATPGPRQALWVEGAGHNDLPWVAGRRYQAALREFVRLVEAHRASGAGTGVRHNTGHAGEQPAQGGPDVAADRAR
jgi:abhydrolase domain-containing protein 17